MSVKLTAKIIKNVNPKLIDRLVDTAENLGRVYVGVSAGKKEHDGVTSTATVAAVHEYGAPSQGIPERPFLRNTIAANLDSYIRLNRINVIKTLQGNMSADTALGQLGAMAAGHVQKFIYSNNYELKPETIKAKGSSRALVDYGQLVQSITYQIADKGSKE